MYFSLLLSLIVFMFCFNGETHRSYEAVSTVRGSVMSLTIVGSLGKLSMLVSGAFRVCTNEENVKNLLDLVL